MTDRADDLSLPVYVSGEPRRVRPSDARGGRLPRLAPARLPNAAILFGPMALVVLWELASRAGWISPKFLAAPSIALLTGFKLLVSGTLVDHFLASAGRAYLGLGIGVAIGVLLAMAAGLSRIGEASIDGLVQVKRAIPTLALIPLAILWLGIGETM